MKKEQDMPFVKKPSNINLNFNEEDKEKIITSIVSKTSNIALFEEDQALLGELKNPKYSSEIKWQGIIDYISTSNKEKSNLYPLVTKSISLISKNRNVFEFFKGDLLNRGSAGEKTSECRLV